MENDERSFTVEASTTEDVGGRYINRAPRDAAKKAARVLFDASADRKKGSGVKSLRLQLRETTRGSPDSLFAYEATKHDIKKTVMIAGKQVRISQEIKRRSVPLFHGDGVRKQKSTKKGGGNTNSSSSSPSSSPR